MHKLNLETRLFCCNLQHLTEAPVAVAVPAICIVLWGFHVACGAVRGTAGIYSLVGVFTDQLHSAIQWGQNLLLWRVPCKASSPSPACKGSDAHLILGNVEVRQGNECSGHSQAHSTHRCAPSPLACAIPQKLLQACGLQVACMFKCFSGCGPKCSVLCRTGNLDLSLCDSETQSI